MHEFVSTTMQPLHNLDRKRLANTYAELETQASSQLADDGYAGERALVTRFADCRYAGQGYEVRFETPAGAIDDEWIVKAAEGFHLAHEREYGHRFEAEIDIVNVRVAGIGLVPPLVWPEIETGDGPSRKFGREVVFASTGVGRSACRRRSTTARRSRRVRRSPARRSSSSTTRPPSSRPAGGRDRPLRQHRRRLHRAKGVGEAGSALATPVLMRVIGGAFQSIAKEMGALLFRMSYSSIIRESGGPRRRHLRRRGQRARRVGLDADVHGRDAEDRQGVIRELAGAIQEGDVIAHNHPYKGATHTPDIGIVVPIFWEGELVAFSGASAHLLDIGGAYPGMAIDLVDMWAEGHIVDAVKLSDQGVRQGESQLGR